MCSHKAVHTLNHTHSSTSSPTFHDVHAQNTAHSILNILPPTHTSYSPISPTSPTTLTLRSLSHSPSYVHSIPTRILPHITHRVYCGHYLPLSWHTPTTLHNLVVVGCRFGNLLLLPARFSKIKNIIYVPKCG